MRNAVNLRREARWLWPIGLLMVVALVCAGYILTKQRLESPLAERYGLNLEFAAVDGVKPETGSPVTVAGVAVGQIDGVRLDDGRGVLHVRIDPGELPSVNEGARAVLVPNTPLKDMQIRLDPGRAGAPHLPDEATIPLRDTQAPVDADELLRALDADTRDWVQLLIHDMGVGFGDRKRDLNALLRDLGPTSEQMRELTDLLARRHETIRDLVSDLRIVAEATAESDDELRAAVDAGGATLEAVASQDTSLQRALELLPESLDAVDGTLARARPFAGALRRGLAALDGPLTKLPRTIEELPDATRGLVPLPAGELAGFVDALAPLGRSVRPATRDLGAAIVPIERAFGALTRTTNAMAHQPEDGRQGYLFWLAWFAHNVNSMTSSGDAHGATIRGYVLMSCASLALAPMVADALTEAGLSAGSCPGGGA